MCIWIIIVNYRTAELAIDCLRSLSGQIVDLKGGQVVVIDNASGDGSVEKLAFAIDHAGWSEWAKIIPMDRNGGFAFGNNAGIRAALAAPKPPDYILLLNPDTIARPDAIKALVSFMDVHPKAGIAGSRLENAGSGLDCTAHNMPSPLSELDAGARLSILSRVLHHYVLTPLMRDIEHQCDWVSGASMVVRRQVFDEIGMLDEGFFLYFEEVDFCCRAKQAGWQVWYVPQSLVVHLGGASTGIRSTKVRLAKYWYDSRRRFFIKHYGICGLVLADILWAVGRATYLIRRALKLGAQKEAQDPRWYLFDLLWGDVRAICNGQASDIQRVQERL